LKPTIAIAFLAVYFQSVQKITLRCHESSSPKPLNITLGSFKFIPKIHRDVRKFATVTSTVVDTGGKEWEQYQTADTLKLT
jgi:hypothetical protein